jgi:hypothetical protein
LADDGARGGSPDAETEEGREDENDEGTLIEGAKLVAHSTASLVTALRHEYVCQKGWWLRHELGNEP